MRKYILLFLFGITCIAQESKFELTPQGFPNQQLTTPNKLLEKLIESSKSWAYYYNKQGHDVLNLTDNSLTIEAKKESAFHNYNVGARYNYDMVYALKIYFKEDNNYTLDLSIKELYSDNVLLKMTTADFFTPEGKVKEDYLEAKNSLEDTVAKIIKSYANYISK